MPMAFSFGVAVQMSRAKDLTGMRFGRLTVIERVPSKSGHARWKCLCDCGSYTEALSNNLKSGAKVSCGCAAHKGSPGISPSNYNDLTGRRFGRLIVIKRISPVGCKVRWLCRCDCGAEKDIAAYELTSGKTKSCGCLQREARHLRKNPDGKGTRLYGVWKGIKSRCYTKSNSGYKHYGARGIKMCDEWRDNYQTFHDWAFANGYDPDAPYGQCTIDRIDVNGDYEPSNCRWVDAATQIANRRPFKYQNGWTKAKENADAIH